MLRAMNSSSMVNPRSEWAFTDARPLRRGRLAPRRLDPGERLRAVEHGVLVRRGEERRRHPPTHPRIVGECPPVAGDLLPCALVERPEAAVVLLDHAAEEIDVPPRAAGG